LGEERGGSAKNAYKILVEKHLGKFYLEEQEGDGRIILRWISGRQVMRLGERQHHLRTESSSGF
jgi:hypothetical protein